MSRRIDVGYVPLLDAAPLIIAAEMGFAAEEGLELALHRELSWAALRDRLIWGGYHAAHMLAPVVVAQTAGIGVGDAAIDALMVLSVNGNMIGAEPGLAAAIAATGCGFLDAGATGRALAATLGGGRCASACRFRSRCMRRSSTTGWREAGSPAASIS